MTPEKYQHVIIGSGEGGKSLAWHLGNSGQQVIVIERQWVGGSCPNTNCLPSKNEIFSAKVADTVHHAGAYGTNVGSATVDMAIVRQRKRQMVDNLVAIHLKKYKASGAELVMGEAKFVGKNELEVRLNDGGTRNILGERVYLNLGTRAAMPAVPGLAQSAPLTNIEALELDHLPEQLVVIGGGYVGLEFAQAFRRFGSRVTVIQHGPKLLTGLDSDVSEPISALFADEGVDVFTSTEIIKVEGRSGPGVRLQLKTAIGVRVLEATDILVATGRTPNTSGIGLELSGVELGPQGYIKVNDRLETTAPNIWAIGECAGSPQFTHASYDDYRIIRDNLAGGSRSTRGRIMPWCLFIDPQVAHIGLTETEARAKGITIRVAKIPMAAVLRTRTTGETRGYMKALVGSDDRILGFTMMGPEAGEVMAIVQTAMLAGSSYQLLREAIYTHPTMAEGLNVLFSGM